MVVVEAAKSFVATRMEGVPEEGGGWSALVMNPTSGVAWVQHYTLAFWIEMRRQFVLLILKGGDREAEILSR